MPQITLTRSNVQSLVSFCEAAKSNSLFIAKNHDAVRRLQRWPHARQAVHLYFKGWNPTKDADFYENACRSYGGDDFGERLPPGYLRKALEDPATRKVRITMTATSIRPGHVCLNKQEL